MAASKTMLPLRRSPLMLANKNTRPPEKFLSGGLCYILLHMKTVVTHNGVFHSDDVFAVATLQLLHGVENLEIIRTRDEVIISKADIVVDVGGEYDVNRQRFDHHQNGASVRENGISYAAFGLVWQTYGVQVAGGMDVASDIERSLVLAVDADDTGITLVDLRNPDISSFELDQVIRSYVPPRGSNHDADVAFMEAVEFARGLLQRLIIKKTASIVMRKIVADAYLASTDKRYLVFDRSVSAADCIEYPEVLFVVCPDDLNDSKNWTATAVRKDNSSFESRVSFPEAWAGLRGEALQAVSGIGDAVFCHKGRFFFVGGSKEGVLQAVKKVV